MVFGQNETGLNAFGEPYRDILQKLYQTEGITILFEKDNDQIAARRNETFLAYTFNQTLMCTFLVSQKYVRVKDAQQAYQKWMDFILSAGAMPAESSDAGNKKWTIATGDGKVYRLTLVTESPESIEVSLHVKRPDLAPLSTLEGVDLQVLHEGN